ncbi:hypothetical protein GOODEAATRI_034476, partial [Goodea atripinnis]
IPLWAAPNSQQRWFQRGVANRAADGHVAVQRHGREPHEGRGAQRVRHLRPAHPQQRRWQDHGCFHTSEQS